MRVLFRVFRITVLLIIFTALAFYTKTQKLKSRSWAAPLQIVIYPMNADNDPLVADYIQHLNDDTFREIDTFFQAEAEAFALELKQPTITKLGPEITEFPPAAPAPGSNIMTNIWWSIQFRLWAFLNTPDDESNLQRVRVFVYYHKPVEGKQLLHSLGLDKGLLSIVNAFAIDQQTQQNNIIIAHELLHTVGASDKYDAHLQPVFPDGYADAEKSPLFPQHYAEIMSAKIPLSENKSIMADNLNFCVIGEKTAIEINWIPPITN